MHSWRVLLLPYLEQERLFDKYDFREPWNGPNNSKLLTLMPDVYRCPSDPRVQKGPSTWTSYVAVVGPRTAWPGAQARKLSDIDSVCNTILVLEDESGKIAWSEPRDLTYDEALGILTSTDLQAGGIHRYDDDFFYEYPGGRNIAFAETAVPTEFSPDGWEREVASLLLTIDDGFRLGDSPPRFLSVQRRLKLGNCYRLGVLVLLTLLPLGWVWRKRQLPAGTGRTSGEGRR